MIGTAPDLNTETILVQLARAREETLKTAGQYKLMAEAQKLDRDRAILPGSP